MSQEVHKQSGIDGPKANEQISTLLKTIETLLLEVQDVRKQGVCIHKYVYIFICMYMHLYMDICIRISYLYAYIIRREGISPIEGTDCYVSSINSNPC
jgi:hypothetical protein